MVSVTSRRAMVDERLAEVLSGIDPPPLEAGLRHAALIGGKRVRPSVTLYTCDALGGSVEDALDYAVGIELVHAASLVVDDIVDRSHRRRGTTSAWAELGHGRALTTSDALLGEAFALFSRDEVATRIVAEAMTDLGVGEATELLDVPATVEDYERLARRKTGSRFRAAAQLGAVVADSDQAAVDAAGEYAERVGVAFQIRDDVLDATADPDTLGKPTGRDAAMDRPSIIHTAGMSPERATRRACEEADRALAALDRLEVDSEEAAGYLRYLARYAAERER